MPKKKETFINGQAFGREEFQSFMDEFQAESPRAGAIMGCAYLDNLLNELLRRRLVGNKKLFKKIDSVTLEQRIDLCYLTGSISNQERHDLHIIRRIRNDFAHEINLNDFDGGDISSKCDQLKVAKFLESRAPDLNLDDPRDKYTAVVSTLMMTLRLRILKPEKLVRLRDFYS